MSGETGHLQRLTDEQVSARVAAYNRDGSLERDIALLRTKAGDLIEAEVSEQFGKDAAERVTMHYAGKVDANWVQSVAEYGRRIVQEKTSVPHYIAARDQLMTRIVGAFFGRFADDSETPDAAVKAFHRLTPTQTDLIPPPISVL